VSQFTFAIWSHLAIETRPFDCGDSDEPRRDSWECITPKAMIHEERDLENPVPGRYRVGPIWVALGRACEALLSLVSRMCKDHTKAPDR
jgi:hypothetical protein